jgi:hypothetical protein
MFSNSHVPLNIYKAPSPELAAIVAVHALTECVLKLKCAAPYLTLDKMYTLTRV